MYPSHRILVPRGTYRNDAVLATIYHMGDAVCNRVQQAPTRRYRQPSSGSQRGPRAEQNSLLYIHVSRRNTVRSCFDVTRLLLLNARFIYLGRWVKIAHAPFLKIIFWGEVHGGGAKTENPGSKSRCDPFRVGASQAQSGATTMAATAARVTR